MTISPVSGSPTCVFTQNPRRPNSADELYSLTDGLAPLVIGEFEVATDASSTSLGSRTTLGPTVSSGRTTTVVKLLTLTPKHREDTPVAYIETIRSPAEVEVHERELVARYERKLMELEQQLLELEHKNIILKEENEDLKVELEDATAAKTLLHDALDEKIQELLFVESVEAEHLALKADYDALKHTLWEAHTVKITQADEIKDLKLELARLSARLK